MKASSFLSFLIKFFKALQAFLYLSVTIDLTLFLAIENFACDPLPPLENGEVFCYDSWKLGTICMGVCKNGWILGKKS